MIFERRQCIGAAAGVGVLALTSACVAPADGSAASAQGQSADLAASPAGESGGVNPFEQGLSIGQNSTWTINRGAAQKYRVVAYGDSIFAGYQGAFTQVARRASPYVAGEYFAKAWGSNVEVVRRAQTGGLASEVYARVVSDKSYMADPSTRAVYFEMCGNDYLQARQAFARSSGTCDTSNLLQALDACVSNTQKAIAQINASAPAAARKVVSNLYYPGFDKDNVATPCTDPATGHAGNVQQTLLPLIARSNWRTCNLAQTNGFACLDAFAEFMGADYDSNGDGVVDSDALRFDPSESEDAYVARISQTVRATVHDSNTHGLTAGTTADYLYTDDTHPTIYLGMISTSSNGQSPPDFSDDQLGDAKNPKWNLFGHERLGAALAKLGPAAP